MNKLLSFLAVFVAPVISMVVGCSTRSFESTARSNGDPTGGTSGTSGSSGTGGGGGTAGAAGDGNGGTAGASGTSGGTGGNSGGGTSGNGSGGDGGDGTGGDGGGGGTGPDPCDPLAPADGCVLDDGDGLYVAPSGDDGASGSKDAPLATLGAAIAQAAGSGRTIYVCNDTFDEHLVIDTDGIVLRGGFECPSASVAGWVYQAGERARVQPADTGYALRIAAADNVTLADLEFQSRDAEMPGESSVAVFVTTSNDVAFERVRIVAGNGMDGADGVLEGSNHFAESLNGNAATGETGGAPKQCQCPDGSTSTGGRGGGGGLSPTAGGAGLPDHGVGGGTPGSPSTLTLACTIGGLGAPGPERADALGADIVGTIDADAGWRPRAGADGLNGQPGQGGGGGGGDGNLGGNTGGGGGGACGGCGGLGGPGGTGGGGSIGVLAFDSTVTLDGASVVETGAAGSGGSGAEGEPGQSGGVRGTANSNGCSGGPGGKGAAGGAGGGGAGGVSVGILSKGGTITADDVSFAVGTAGAAGQGAGADHDGIGGLSANELAL